MGRISATKDKDGNPKINPITADKEWEQTTDPSKQRNNEGEDSSSSQSYLKARAVRETYQARIAKLEFEEKTGKLIDAEKVKLEAFEVARIVRDALLNIPNRISNELAGEPDPVKVHKLLSQEITRALEELVRANRR
ncbi:MAG: hypothetical protein SGI74_12965 [Oligoflexia bacterium]|nr:hypothetical protein [Oligoflexia bacterium]